MNFRNNIRLDVFKYFKKPQFSERFLKVILLSFSIWILPLKLYSQQTVSGVPYSAIFNIERINAFEVMPEYSSLKSVLKSGQVSSRLKRLEFAHVFDVAFRPENSGEWINLANGERIWRMGLVSKGAFSLNMIFGAFNLNSGVKVYVYSPNQHDILGAFSAKNNNNDNSLAIEPVQGDTVIVELNVPADIYHYGALEINKLGHDFLNIFGSKLKNGYEVEGSGSCNVDINCDPGFIWQPEKNSVCKMIVNASDLCTGTLMNNTALDNMPYVLTANHCIDTSTKAVNTVFIFNYEKWKCGGKDGPRTTTLSGSQLIATTPNLDFSLVRLYSLPTFISKPYLAGWDRSNNPPLNSATIHHPNGDFKKITIDNNKALTGNFLEDYNPNTHWLISRWELGTTERGSSGSPLFNQNHLVIGDLTGGDASCTIPINDYFAKLYHSWADYPSWNQQLKHWLDPMQTNPISIIGLDPYAAEKSSCDTFWNISQTESRILYNTNLSWGNYSGHNSELVTQFAEKIDVAGALKIAGLYLHVAKAYNSSSLSYITIKLWKGGDIPGEEITTRSVFIKDLVLDKENYLEFDSVIYIDGPVYLGYAVNYSASQDTVALYQSNDRGTAGYSGMFLFKTGVWRNISEITTPSMHSSLAVGLISCSLLNGKPKINLVKSEVLHLYPNPVNGILNVDLPLSGKAEVFVIDLLGREHKMIVKQDDARISMDTGNLAPGVYIIKVLVPGNKVFAGKFMVIK